MTIKTHEISNLLETLGLSVGNISLDDNFLVIEIDSFIEDEFFVFASLEDILRDTINMSYENNSITVEYNPETVINLI